MGDRRQHFPDAEGSENEWCDHGVSGFLTA